MADQRDHRSLVRSWTGEEVGGGGCSTASARISRAVRVAAGAVGAIPSAHLDPWRSRTSSTVVFPLFQEPKVLSRPGPRDLTLALSTLRGALAVRTKHLPRSRIRPLLLTPAVEIITSSVIPRDRTDEQPCLNASVGLDEALKNAPTSQRGVPAKLLEVYHVSVIREPSMARMLDGNSTTSEHRDDFIQLVVVANFVPFAPPVQVQKGAV
ncbi:uncharacterized protein PAC_01047 [Phialocephala subalpina]|uniref:Uncharacterized protein n=1 Tax=Phialocephala subalpina TaxID=576137 RepID=A0A1L7WEG1_9HELO|nr:uncharacterized protein PAC_01047 [Phialocephala subalpina]